MDKQREFLYSPAKLAAISGGFGASKTVTGCTWGVLIAWRISGSQHLVGRLNKPALESTTQATYLSLCPAEWVAEWTESKGYLRLKNNAEVYFKHLDMSDADIKGHIRSMNLTTFLVDQSEEVTESTFLTLVGRLRRRTDPTAHFGRLLFNPAGHDWEWRRFFDPDRADALKKNAGFTVSTYDNALNLPEGYIQGMQDNYPKDWLDRFVTGSFADWSDLVYKDFDSKVHVWDSTDWMPPKEWPVIVGIDFGGADPWSVSFIAIEPTKGLLFLFDEIYERTILVSEIAERYRFIMEGRNLEGMAYDYENQQAAMELAEHDVTGSPANKDVRAGIFKVAQYLHCSPRVEHYFTHKTPGPRLYFASHCHHHIEEIEGWKWAKDRSGELKQPSEPVDRDNHTCDSKRYAIHTFRPEPAQIDAPKIYENKDLNPASRLYWHRAALRKEDEDKHKDSPLIRSPFSRKNPVLHFRSRRGA